MTDSTRLDGKVAIVTGAVQGIGRGIANVLSEAGATIVIGDLQDATTTVEEIRSKGGQAISMKMDTSNSSDANAVVDFAISEYGRLDVLVNNAAIDAPDGNAWDLTDAEWQRTVDVDLSGVFYCCRAAINHMMESGGGSIINISSQSARSGAKGLSPAYNASKAGVLGLTIALSAQVAEFGVRVNAVMPSLVLSRDFGWTPEQHMERAMRMPLGTGTPRDVGEAVRFLASSASRWVSGTAIQLTGGGERGA